MYGTLLAFSIAILIVSLGLAASRVDARSLPHPGFWPGVVLLFVTAVTLIGFASVGLGS